MSDGDLCSKLEPLPTMFWFYIYMNFVAISWILALVRQKIKRVKSICSYVNFIEFQQVQSNRTRSLIKYNTVNKIISAFVCLDRLVQIADNYGNLQPRKELFSILFSCRLKFMGKRWGNFYNYNRKMSRI